MTLCQRNRVNPNPDIDLTCKICDLAQVGEGVNARHTDGHYYSAFVSRVHGDDTYDVYYTEYGDEAKGNKENTCGSPYRVNVKLNFPIGTRI